MDCFTDQRFNNISVDITIFRLKDGKNIYPGQNDRIIIDEQNTLHIDIQVSFCTCNNKSNKTNNNVKQIEFVFAGFFQRK